MVNALKKRIRVGSRAVISSVIVVYAICVSTSFNFGVWASNTSDSSPAIKHVIVIVLENASYKNTYGNASETPYLKSIANEYSLLQNYHGIAHPSLPNYLAMISGSDLGVLDDKSPSQHTAISQSKEITSLMQSKGVSWKAYMESMPSACDKTSSGLYAVRHNPFVYFEDITSDNLYCANHVVDFSYLDSDLSDHDNLPNFAFIIPNLNNDGHDTDISDTDSWLREFLPKIITSSSFANSVVFVIFDEDDPATEDNHIYAAIIGPANIVKPGAKSEVYYDHYSFLATIENIFMLGNLGRNDASATPITDIFQPDIGITDGYDQAIPELSGVTVALFGLSLITTIVGTIIYKRRAN